MWRNFVLLLLVYCGAFSWNFSAGEIAKVFRKSPFHQRTRQLGTAIGDSSLSKVFGTNTKSALVEVLRTNILIKILKPGWLGFKTKFTENYDSFPNKA